MLLLLLLLPLVCVQSVGCLALASTRLRCVGSGAKRAEGRDVVSCEAERVADVEAVLARNAREAVQVIRVLLDAHHKLEARDLLVARGARVYNDAAAEGRVGRRLDASAQALVVAAAQRLGARQSVRRVGHEQRWPETCERRVAAGALQALLVPVPVERYEQEALRNAPQAAGAVNLGLAVVVGDHFKPVLRITGRCKVACYCCVICVLRAQCA